MKIEGRLETSKICHVCSLLYCASASSAVFLSLRVGNTKDWMMARAFALTRSFFCKETRWRCSYIDGGERRSTIVEHHRSSYFRGQIGDNWKSRDPVRTSPLYCRENPCVKRNWRQNGQNSQKSIKTPRILPFQAAGGLKSRYYYALTDWARL